MYQRIVELLQIHGYTKTNTSAGPCYIKYGEEKEKGVLITYKHNPDGSMISEEDIFEMIVQIKNILGAETPILAIILSEEGKVTFADWENEFQELYDPVAMIVNAERDSEKEERCVKKSFGKYKMTILIAVINFVLFLISEIYGEGIYDIGACSPYMVLEQHQFYRLLTSNYLHYGWDHFFNNMVVFCVLGSSLEKIMGSFRYFILYTGSGLIGSIISVFYYAAIGEDVLSAGASGAIFGITGALAAIFLFSRKQRGDFNGSGIFIMIAGSIYHGFQSSGTDNAAHIGGCIGGFILALLLYILWQGKSE